MNRFSEFHPDGCIDTDSDVRTFYNTILSCTKTYKRASAYFSQGFYEYISKGLTQLLENDGSMQLLLSTEVDAKSLSEIKTGFELRENKSQYILECLKKGHIDLDNIETPIVVYLIAINKLDIKFVFKEEGLFHDKYAIFTDSYSDELILTGSGNETSAAVLKNHESFDVTYTWDDSSEKELKKIADRKKKFIDTWNNEVEDLVVLPLTEVIKEDLIEKYLSKQLNVFDEYKPFLRVSFDENNSINVQTNKDITTVLSNFNASLFTPFITKQSNNRFELNNKLQFRDISIVIQKLETICSELSLRLVLSQELKNYLERNYVDMENLARKGREIKNYNKLKADQNYVLFSENIQKLVKRPLKEKQIQAAYHISELKRAMNFSVPGSGKTASVLGAYEYLHSIYVPEDDRISRILVLGPLNCFKAWKEEYRLVSPEYDLKRESIDIIDISEMGNIGDKSTILKYGGFQKAKLVLINFDVITSLVNVLFDLVDSHTLIVFDEIHRIKNFESEKLPSCLKIIDKSKYRVALTGTPLPNGYKDLFAMFKLLYGEYVFNYFGMSTEDLQKADKTFEAQGIESKIINDKINPFYIRVSKKDLQVPEANEDHLIYVDTTEEEKLLYNQILQNEGNSLEKIIKLTQIGCIPNKVNSRISLNEAGQFNGHEESDVIPEAHEIDYQETSKIKKLLELIKENPCKSVIWCIFTETIEKLTNILEKNNYKVAKIYGITSLDERSEIIDKFNNTDTIDFLITNPHTLAESVSLHKACHRAYYIELNYNLSQYLQSRDRIHRLGLTPDTKTDYYIFINKYDDTEESALDHIIYKRLKMKEQKMIEAIDKGNLIFKNGTTVGDLDDLITKARKGNKK